MKRSRDNDKQEPTDQEGTKFDLAKFFKAPDEFSTEDYVSS